MYMHIIRVNHPQIGLLRWSITQKWDSTDLIWGNVVSNFWPHCRPTERSRHQPLVPPYSCSSLWTLWKVSGVGFTSTKKYTWKSKIPVSAETRSHLFGGSPISNERSWTSFMPRFILTWLYRLHQGSATRRRCLWHSIGPAIWCLSPPKKSTHLRAAERSQYLPSAGNATNSCWGMLSVADDLNATAYHHSHLAHFHYLDLRANLVIFTNG